MFGRLQVGWAGGCGPRKPEAGQPAAGLWMPAGDALLACSHCSKAGNRDKHLGKLLLFGFWTGG